jgi:hypothetical protein
VATAIPLSDFLADPSLEAAGASMIDVTQILGQVERGDGQAAEKLLPLVYDELRKLAADKMAQEDPGQTLQPTALVHEAYLRLVDVATGKGSRNEWHCRLSHKDLRQDMGRRGRSVGERL